MARTYCKDYTNSNFKQLYIPEINMFTENTINEEEYLAISSKWKELREKRLRLDDYKCVRCGTAIQLEVHHIRYPKAWGLEKIDEIATMCDSCHKKLHDIKEAK